MSTGRHRIGERTAPWPALALLALAACSPSLPESVGECWTLALVPGPEDLVLVPGEDAALVSSQDRRAAPRPDGAIWYVPLDSTDPARRARRLTLRGRHGDCSFHPHGIDLVEIDEDRKLLYVVNHHDPEDLAVERGCLDAPNKAKPRASVTSVEVFEYRGGELYFLQRLADPQVLTWGNDLVARPDGDVWVTNPPPGSVARLADFQGWDLFDRSKVVRFDCDGRSDEKGRCTGEWEEVELPFPEPPRWVNGIEIREGTDPPLLVLASTGGERIHVARIVGEAELDEVGEICLRGMPDNLTWERDGEGALLVAAHPLRRRFTQHARNPGTPSPSKVYRLRPGSAGSCPTGDEQPKRTGAGGLVFRDAGGRVSAASVAARVGDDLILGQVFEAGVVRCRTHPRKPADGGER